MDSEERYLGSAKCVPCIDDAADAVDEDLDRLDDVTVGSCVSSSIVVFEVSLDLSFLQRCYLDVQG